MGSGSTVVAAEAVGLHSIGVERYLDYFEMGCVAIAKLADVKMHLEMAFVC